MSHGPIPAAAAGVDTAAETVASAMATTTPDDVHDRRNADESFIALSYRGLQETPGPGCRETAVLALTHRRVAVPSTPAHNAPNIHHGHASVRGCADVS